MNEGMIIYVFDISSMLTNRISSQIYLFSFKVYNNTNGFAILVMTHGFFAQPNHVMQIEIHVSIFELLLEAYRIISQWKKEKIDGVGHIDTRPSTHKLHHFVQKIKKKKKRRKKWHMTPDTWHLTPDMWHLTCDMWHGTWDTWWGVNILLTVQLPSSNGWEFMMYWRLGGEGSANQVIN